jgi:hypothetical protein
MTATISAIVNGTTTNLMTLAPLVSHDGWGMTPVRRITERGAQQNGVTLTGYRLDPRQASLIFKADKVELDDMYTLRQTLLNLFVPQQTISLLWAMSYGNRQIDVVYSGEMSLSWQVKEWAAQKMVVNFLAPDPTFYNPTLFGNEFFFSPPGTPVPTPIPTPIGAGGFTGPIAYRGNWQSLPIITLYGPATDPIITNQTTGEVLDFTGTTIASGDYYVIDCSYGAKTVTDSLGVNRIADLTAASDLGTFHLAEARPGEASRNNVINVNCTAATASISKAVIEYYERYLGV